MAFSRSFPRVLLALCLFSLHAQADPSANAASRARELVTRVQAKAGAKELARAELAQAENALVRADRAHKSGDHAHAALLEGIALEWAEAASELERAAAAERGALELEKKLEDAEKKTIRAQALLEQTAARKARASTQLTELEAAAGVAKEEANRATETKAPETKKASKPEPAKPAAKPKAKAVEPAPAKPVSPPAPEKKQ